MQPRTRTDRARPSAAMSRCPTRLHATLDATAPLSQRIDERPGSRGAVFRHVIGIARSRDDAGDSRMREDVFEQQLRPRATAVFGRPLGNRLGSQTADERSSAERAVGDDGDAAVGGERQQFLRGLGFLERIVHLHEIEWLAAHHRRQLRVSAGRVVRDPEVADRALRLPVAQRGQVRPPVEQVVNLHQIEPRRPEERERTSHLLDAGLSPPGPHFGRDKRALPRARRGEALPHDCLGAAVHRGAVDHRSAGVEERADDTRQRRDTSAVRRDIERLPGSAPDDRKGLARRGNGSGLHPRIVAYSSRSATLGSTFDARRAGTYDARSATSTSSGTTRKNVRGS